MPAFASLFADGDACIGELRFERAQHALRGALGYRKPLRHLIEADTRVARRCKGRQL